jgi:hypothetical protein
VGRRALVVHRAPRNGAYTEVRAFGEDETVTVVELGLALPVSSLL